MNVVVIGANRGIGLGFVRYYLEAGCHVWASYRSDIGELGNLNNDHLNLFQWDVCEDHSTDYVSKCSLPNQIDLLINNAGIYGSHKGGQSLETISREAMLETFDVNCIGPVMTVQALESRLVKGSIIVNISSKMGSSADNSSGGTYAYRASKAALTICSKSMAVDLEPRGIHVITLHPGWVRTDMTSHSGLIDVEASVAGMTKVISHCREYPPGSFLAFDGQVIPY